MGLLILLILVFMAMYMSVLINADKVLAKFGRFSWYKKVWRGIEVGLVAIAALAAAFDFESEMVCLVCALLILLGGVAIYFRFSPPKWRIALIIAVASLIAGCFLTPWLMLLGSFIILACSVTILDDEDN